MVLAIVLVVLVAGSVLFHVLSPWYFTPIASNWGMIDDTVHITFWVTGIVFVAVNLFLAWCVVRYRHGKVKQAMAGDADDPNRTRKDDELAAEGAGQELKGKGQQFVGKVKGALGDDI